MDDHIIFSAGTWELSLLDQRLLPGREERFICSDCDDVIYAIKTMVVRGAPAIGVAAAYGCVLAARECAGYADWPASVREKLAALENARPTAVNLSWAVNRMRKEWQGDNALELAENWLKIAREIQKRDVEICRRIGAHGQVVLKDGFTVLTHCNAGALATAGFGTALGVIRAAVLAGKKIKVIADETRPLLQGARLTAYELARDGIPTTVACDNSCAALMQRGLVQAVVAGADRIAANGDTANKIGTLGVAILASHFGIPFYIAAPLSTIDLSIPAGQSIPVEERAGEEVCIINGSRIIPENVPVYNFAFDVTPAALITGIITEAGILAPPYDLAITRAFAEEGQ